MPNTKSSIKDLRSARAAHTCNQAARSKVNTYRRKMAELVQAGDKAAAMTFYSELCSVVDKAVKSGILKSNTGDRRKSVALRGIQRLA